MTSPTGVTGMYLFLLNGHEDNLETAIGLGTQLSRGRWAFAFALVTSLFFTWGFAYDVRISMCCIERWSDYGVVLLFPSF